jgi:5-methyltetrahydropteroyltriglutamate--homocysteine methyltransferase
VAGSFDPLSELPSGKRAFIGLVSTKSADLEQQKVLVEKINAAAKVVSLGQLGISPQCGFASSISSWNKTAIPWTKMLNGKNSAS